MYTCVCVCGGGGGGGVSRTESFILNVQSSLVSFINSRHTHTYINLYIFMSYFIDCDINVM